MYEFAVFFDVGCAVFAEYSENPFMGVDEGVVVDFVVY